MESILNAIKLSIPRVYKKIIYITIYGRVSTEKQSIDGFGLDLQVEELINEDEKSNLEYKTYIDSGISGTLLKKREGLKMKECIVI